MSFIITICHCHFCHPLLSPPSPFQHSIIICHYYPPHPPFSANITVYHRHYSITVSLQSCFSTIIVTFICCQYYQASSFPRWSSKPSLLLITITILTIRTAGAISEDWKGYITKKKITKRFSQVLDWCGESERGGTGGLRQDMAGWSCAG